MGRDGFRIGRNVPVSTHSANLIAASCEGAYEDELGLEIAAARLMRLMNVPFPPVVLMKWWARRNVPFTLIS